MVLAPGEYAYVQDESKGQIKVHVGPTLINQTAQDRPVIFDPATKSFKRVGLEQAVRPCPVASEGDYVILENPSSDERNKFPPEGTVAVVAPSLKSGRKINISGPCTFGLWPMQIATVVPGHHLRSNQYLLVRSTASSSTKTAIVAMNVVPRWFSRHRPSSSTLRTENANSRPSN
jgi:major vault protein